MPTTVSKPKPTVQELPLGSIRTDGGTQCRVELDEATIESYAALLVDGAEFPPLVVFWDGADYWLADGFHRWHAFDRALCSHAPCEVHEGNKRAALLFAAGANSHHGLRRTNLDKRKSVLMLLRDPDWFRQSDRWIAETCGVSHTFVATLRQELAGGGAKGKAKPAATPEPEPEREPSDGSTHVIDDGGERDPDLDDYPPGADEPAVDDDDDDDVDQEPDTEVWPDEPDPADAEARAVAREAAIEAEFDLPALVIVLNRVVSAAAQHWPKREHPELARQLRSLAESFGG